MLRPLEPDGVGKYADLFAGRSVAVHQPARRTPIAQAAAPGALLIRHLRTQHGARQPGTDPATIIVAGDRPRYCKDGT